ncbi:MAG: alpha-amylase family glycosyl hydrolase [Acidimicrobiia bacterium]
MPDQDSVFLEHLEFLYGEEPAETILPQLEELIRCWSERIVARLPHPFTEKDIVLITYGDSIRQPEEHPLATLSDFLTEHVGDVVNTVHVLPFFPYSSDDGFSIIDYRAVDPALGDWDDVRRIGREFRLMFDGVINHVSVESDWFQAFLRDDPRYREYFTVIPSDVDTTSVFRPRALPLLTQVHTSAGPRFVWTTFGPDQVDLNYRNPAVLLAVIDTVLFYVAQGANLIRLDAIAFIWKELGTPCIHLPEVHRIVQLLRAVLDSLAPDVAIVTETNVPHNENVSYFGDGTNEAHMVYNFALPPLVLHAFHTGSARALSAWAQNLNMPTDETTFLNFLSSHDGIGVGGARGILTEDELDRMAERVGQSGGAVAHKDNGDGTQSVYELNINFLDALQDPAIPNADTAFVARRFLTSQAIMLALRGVPAIYIHSLLGSHGWSEGVEQTGMPRAVNREKISRAAIETELGDQGSLRSRVFRGYHDLLSRRNCHGAFSPEADQHVIPSDDPVFALIRVAAGTGGFVLCLHNVSATACAVRLELTDLPLRETIDLTDLIGGERFILEGGTLSQRIEPYQTLWLTEGNK